MHKPASAPREISSRISNLCTGPTTDAKEVYGFSTRVPSHPREFGWWGYVDTLLTSTKFIESPAIASTVECRPMRGELESSGQGCHRVVQGVGRAVQYTVPQRETTVNATASRPKALTLKIRRCGQQCTSSAWRILSNLCVYGRKICVLHLHWQRVEICTSRNRTAPVIATR